MKRESRVLGVDDAPFDKDNKKEKVLVVGVVFRGGNFMDGVISGNVLVDGEDATDEIARMVKDSKFYHDLKCIMLKGIAVAGLNVIDIKRLFKETGIPVMVVMRKNPGKDIVSVLEKLGMDEKTRMVEKAGGIAEVNGLFIQSAGLERSEIKELLGVTVTRSGIPEPLRVAHLIAGGVVNGESKGKA